MSASKTFDLRFYGGEEMATPDVCVVCHSPSTTITELHDSKSDGNIITHYKFPVKLCEECAQRASNLKGVAVILALAIFVLCAVILVAFLVYGANLPKQASVGIGGLLGGLLCFGIISFILGSVSWGIASSILVDNGGPHVRKAVRIKVDEGFGCWLVFSDKALAIAIARKNLGPKTFDWQEKFDEWSKDEEALRRADDF